MAKPRFTVSVTYKHQQTIQVATKDEDDAKRKEAERVGHAEASHKETLWD